MLPFFMRISTFARTGANRLPDERPTKVAQVLAIYRQLRDADLARFAMYLDHASDAEVDEWTGVAVKLFLEMTITDAATTV
jgi:hypothetical protein